LFAQPVSGPTLCAAGSGLFLSHSDELENRGQGKEDEPTYRYRCPPHFPVIYSANQDKDGRNHSDDARGPRSGERWIHIAIDTPPAIEMQLAGLTDS